MSKTLHTWQCPKHGVLHTFKSDPADGTDANATEIAVKATNDRYRLRGSGDLHCPELVEVTIVDPVTRAKRKGFEACGEHVTHMAGLA